MILPPVIHASGSAVSQHTRSVRDSLCCQAGGLELPCEPFLFPPKEKVLLEDPPLIFFFFNGSLLCLDVPFGI